MSTLRFISSHQNCATCGRWAGARVPNVMRQVEVDAQARGRCMGGGLHMQLTGPMTACPKWELTPALKAR